MKVFKSIKIDLKRKYDVAGATHIITPETQIPLIYEDKCDCCGKKLGETAILIIKVKTKKEWKSGWGAQVVLPENQIKLDFAGNKKTLNCIQCMGD